MTSPICPECGAAMDYSTEGPTPFFHCPSCHAMIQNLIRDEEPDDFEENFPEMSSDIDPDFYDDYED